MALDSIISCFKMNLCVHVSVDVYLSGSQILVSSFDTLKIRPFVSPPEPG